MRIGTSARNLSSDEQKLVNSVFGSTLPPWSNIFIDDGLGIYDAPYTLDGPAGTCMIHIGPVGYPDCTSKAMLGTFGTIDAVFIHEMTHVWQYAKGDNVKTESLWAQTAGAGYSYVLGKAWDDYNVEQQASIVENWYAAGMSVTGPEFPYIDKVVRKGGGPNISKPLAALKALP
jgi:hypothetical protein